MSTFRRVEKNSTPGLSVQCAECGRMLPYDTALVGPAPFKFYHAVCAAALEAR